MDKHVIEHKVVTKEWLGSSIPNLKYIPYKE